MTKYYHQETMSDTHTTPYGESMGVYGIVLIPVAPFTNMV